VRPGRRFRVAVASASDDVIDVARPVLEQSPQLHDAELVKTAVRLGVVSV